MRSILILFLSFVAVFEGILLYEQAEHSQYTYDRALEHISHCEKCEKMFVEFEFTMPYLDERIIVDTILDAHTQGTK